MNLPRVPLYDRLPEIYRIRDAEITPPGQLAEFLASIEQAFSAVHESVEALYDDLFIDTCEDWVIAYIADLLGTTHLKGDPRTLRADVADTIALRRRKGTLGTIERLAVNLTGWAARAVELRVNLGWTQHLNHQRPDAGGLPPYGTPAITRFTVPRGGTVPVRDPAMLDLLGTPFDPFAYNADVKAAEDQAVHYNLPNLAIFLWRLQDYRLRLVRPLAKRIVDLGPPPPGSGHAHFAVGFDLHPLDYPVRLFNARRGGFAPRGLDVVAPLTDPDAVPGPMLDARLGSGSEAGHPAGYVAVDFFDDASVPPTGFDLTDVGLHFFLPQSQQPAFSPPPGVTEFPWAFRDDNLCIWENGLRRPLGAGEIVIDPDIGRVLFGLASAAQRDAIAFPDGAEFVSGIYASFTYGAVGPVGAHPIAREAAPTKIDDQLTDQRPVSVLPGGASLESQLGGLHAATAPVVVEIRDSLVHDLDLSVVAGSATEGGVATFLLNCSLVIRAAGGHRPILRLARPLAFRPVTPGDPSVTKLTVRLEGLYLARGAAFPPDAPLIARAAVARLELIDCTLDPGGFRRRDNSRAPLFRSLTLENGYGFVSATDQDAFVPTPDIVIQHSITGALAIDDGYRVAIDDAIVDAGHGVGDDPGTDFALAAATDPVNGWAAALAVSGVTFFGRVRVTEARGEGAIFVQRLEVWNHQKGCLKFSYFSGDGDRLPPNHGCVYGTEARLAFTAEWFHEPAYGQLAPATDRRIATRGPGDDAMGAFNFLLEAHRRANLDVRLREFMPVGVRPLVLPVT